MLDPSSGSYFALDVVGNRIWTLLAAPQRVDALCATLGNEFDATPETCRTDVLAFLEQLADSHLVTIS